MAYFPIFVELEGVPGLIIGGGRVALAKVERLLPYGPKLTLAAPDILPALEAVPGLTLLRRPFEAGDLAGAAFVVAAAGPETDRRAAALCRARGIPVNVVDDRQESTFLFPALLRRGALSVGVSTGGSSPSAAVALRDQFAEEIPERVEEVLDYLAVVRTRVKAALPAGPGREALLRALCSRCLELGRPLTAAEELELWRREGVEVP